MRRPAAGVLLLLVLGREPGPVHMLSMHWASCLLNISPTCIATLFARCTCEVVELVVWRRKRVSRSGPAVGEDEGMKSTGMQIQHEGKGAAT